MVLKNPESIIGFVSQRENVRIFTFCIGGKDQRYTPEKSYFMGTDIIIAKGREGA